MNENQANAVFTIPTKNQLVEEGYLMEKFSEDNKLVLYNYTNKCQFEKKWNEITLNSRGHIFEVETNNLIALPFPKFFNLSELSPNQQKEILQRTDYTLTEKIDGSLGIIYYYNNEWQVNTRGSFNSEQAIKAKRLLLHKYHFNCMAHNLTFLVEIIYPENRIVIDYGNEEKLVLLSIYDRKTKKEGSREEIEEYAELFDFPIVKEYQLTYDDMFKFQEKDQLSIEGFVVRYNNGLRIKIKSKRYLDVARILTNLTPSSLWKYMKQGKVDRGMLEIIPEEFYEEINTIIDDLENKYKELEKEINLEYNKLEKLNLTRKEIGINNSLKHKSCMFSLLDQKNEKIENYIMKRIKPKQIKEV
ncbi:MAG: RNA ligase [Candidatus Thorarchaeota archaeon]